jgi:SAM-dependent methyltransferase
VAAVRPTAFRSKRAALVEKVHGRTVLHIGAVGETCESTEARVEAAPRSVHAYLTAAASACVGVDYDEPSVKMLTERGVFTNLICADVTTLERSDIPLERVDVIVAGDTIEHLSNPGTMLDAMRRLADPGTQLIVTTPNALGLLLFLRHTLGKPIEGADHVCSFNAATLTNLLVRHRWAPLEMMTCYQERARSVAGFRLGTALFHRFPRWGGTLLVVAARA